MAAPRPIFRPALALLAAAAVAGGLLGLPGGALAAFRVSPLRVDLDEASTTGAITVTNDGAEPLTIQMKALAWTQDAAGNDRYAETSALVFFPKVVTIEKSGVQVIRVGAKQPPSEGERCYRLYIDQLPSPRRTEETRVNLLISLGVPVFVRPAGERSATAVAETAVAGGKAGILVRNTGNEHFKIEKIRLRGLDGEGQEVFSREIAGRYLHAGASRRFEEEIPADACPLVNRLRVSVLTDRSVFEGDTAVGEGSCRP